jgi:hypothetical protein
MEDLAANLRWNDTDLYGITVCARASAGIMAVAAIPKNTRRFML